MIISFIPARGGSKSIPLKNIKQIAGKPLIYWTVSALQNCHAVDKIIVATDSDEITATVNSFGFNKCSVYRRKPENAEDKSATEDVILEYINAAQLKDEDLFLLVQATSPFTQNKDFDAAFELYKNAGYDSLLSAVSTKRFFWDSNGTPINYNYKARPRRQDFDGLFMENGAFYINTVRNILQSGNRLSGKIGIYEMPEYAGFEIDEPDDWIICENLMYKHIIANHPVPEIKLFITDVDGVLTDAGMYYSENGDELKKFNTHDGKGFELLRNAGIKTAIITSEKTAIVERRAKKLKIDYVYQGINNKLEAAREICSKEGITLQQAAYIGDDINDLELLTSVAFAACPENAIPAIKSLPHIIRLNRKGGEGAVREFIETVLNN